MFSELLRERAAARLSRQPRAASGFATCASASFHKPVKQYFSGALRARRRRPLRAGLRGGGRQESEGDAPREVEDRSLRATTSSSKAAAEPAGLESSTPTRDGAADRTRADRRARRLGRSRSARRAGRPSRRSARPAAPSLPGEPAPRGSHSSGGFRRIVPTRRSSSTTRGTAGRAPYGTALSRRTRRRSSPTKAPSQP